MKVIVNNTEFNDAFCRMHLQRIFQEFPGISEKDAKKKVADELVKHILVKEHAAKEISSVPKNRIENQLIHIKASYPSEAEYRQMLAANRLDDNLIREKIADDIRINMFINKLTKNIPPAPQKVIEEFYRREHKVSLKPKEIHAAHIVKSITPDTANQVFREMCAIRKKLLNGADFAETADKYSGCNDKGGDLGWFSRGKMVEEFDVILFSMNPGEISPVFQTHFGYHIATVYEIRQEEKRKLSECIDDIKELIHNRMVEQMLDQWLEKVKKKANIRIEY
jgi:parvulin-like peptidyl-prolyl isomerase